MFEKVRKFLPNVSKKAAIAAFLSASVATSAWFGYARWQEERSAHVLLSAFHTLYGDFSGGVFRFSVKDFGRKIVLDHETMEKYRYSDLPKNFFAQSVNPVEWGVLVTWGRPGNSPKSWKVYAIGKDGVASTYMSTDDFRFRNCATGSINGEEYFAGLTHGQGYLNLRSLTTGKDRILHIPYVPKVNVWGDNFVTLFHFIDFIDLDRDGSDEIYFTSTSPYAWVQWSQGQYAEGTVVSVTLPKDGWKPKIEDLGIPLPAFPRRLSALRAPFKESVLVLYDGMLDGEGKTVLPVRVYRYFRDEKWSVVKKEVASISGHSECKTISTWNFRDEPTVQIGCDNSTLYFFKEDGDGLKQVAEMKFSEELVTEAYRKKRADLKPWSLYSIHAVLGKDVDGDGKDEMVVAINNDGFYLVDSKNPDDRSKYIRFGFKGWERILDRDESFVFTDGAFENDSETPETSPFFKK